MSNPFPLYERPLPAPTTELFDASLDPTSLAEGDVLLMEFTLCKDGEDTVPHMLAKRVLRVISY